MALEVLGDVRDRGPLLDSLAALCELGGTASTEVCWASATVRGHPLRGGVRGPYEQLVTSARDPFHTCNLMQMVELDRG